MKKYTCKWTHVVQNHVVQGSTVVADPDTMSLLDQVNTAPGFWCVAIDFMNLPGLPKAICLFLKLIIIGVQLLYNVVLVSAVQQKVNQLHICIFHVLLIATFRGRFTCSF